MTQGEATAAIEAADGHVSSGVRDITDLLVMGSGTYVQDTKAATRGIPVIDTDTLRRLLDGEEIELEVDVVEQGDASLDDLIGEARAALDGKPDSQMWVRILRMVDTCDPAYLPELIDYLEPHIARWDIPADAR